MNRNDAMFNKKTVIITGACGGVGKALIKEFAEQGANLVLTDLNETTLAELTKTVNKNNGNAVFLAGDISKKETCVSLVELCINTFSTVDVLINNAGIIPRGTIEETTDEMWDLAMGVNINALFYLCRSVFPHMKKQKQGAIVNVSSMWGLYPGPNHVAYITAKGACAIFTKTLARDFAPHGIRVNGVAPNEVNTPMLKSGFEKRGLNPTTAIADLNKTVPLGRIAEPEDIVDVIAFLSSEKSRYVVGEIIELSGAKPVTG